MNAQQILTMLKPFSALLVPVLQGLEVQAMDELKVLVAKETSPDLQLVFSALVVALDTIAKAEISKLG